jgi:beta-RFAP synthase
MIRHVAIQTGARLHFGLFAHRPQTGRHFGGVGLMIDLPGVHLTATPNKRDEVAAPDCIQDRVRSLVANYREQTAELTQTIPCRMEVHRTIPAHQGLGSGTQLALAVGQALAILDGESDVSVLELAQRIGRGKRSALGIHGFEQGGLLVDGGKRQPEDIGTLVSRHEFPSAWRIVLVTPTRETGLSGAQERMAFEQLAGMPVPMTDRLCRIVLMDLLPALVERSFQGVSESLYEYGQQVGAYFEPIQGGRFASRQMEQFAQLLRNRGHVGVGQSSWGPTLFVLQESQAAAEELVRELTKDRNGQGCTFQIATALNQGARIHVELG